MTEEKNLVQFIKYRCEKYGDNIFIDTIGDEKITYKEFLQLCSNSYKFLQSFNIKKDDRVSIILPNNVEFIVLLNTIWIYGGIAVNLNINFTALEIKNRLLDADVSMIITTEEVYDNIKEVITELGIKKILLVGKNKDYNLDVLRKVDYSSTFLLIPEYNKDQTAFLQYTGGTSGGIKAAVLTHGNILANINQLNNYFSSIFSEGEECNPVTIPLYHVFSITLQILVFMDFGSTSILYPYPRDLSILIKILKEKKITYMIGVNTMYKMIMQSNSIRNDDLKYLKLSMGGGEHIQVKTKNDWLQMTGNVLYEAFGMTETAAVAFANPIDNNNMETIGIPIKDTYAKLIDENDIEINTENIPGELLLKGPQVVKKYWNRPDENINSFIDGWLRTGDIGIWINCNYIKIIDRKKDMISVSGLKVFPNEVESTIISFPDIIDCGVVGKIDDKTGEKVVAFIVSNININNEILIEYCKQYLSSYKVPKIIKRIDKIPKSPIGKTLRNELKKIANQ